MIHSLCKPTLSVPKCIPGLRDWIELTSYNISQHFLWLLPNLSLTRPTQFIDFREVHLLNSPSNHWRTKQRSRLQRLLQPPTTLPTVEAFEFACRYRCWVTSTLNVEPGQEDKVCAVGFKNCVWAVATSRPKLSLLDDVYFDTSPSSSIIPTTQSLIRANCGRDHFISTVVVWMGM